MLQGEHSAILLTCIKLPFSIKILVLSIFKWPLKTGFTVLTFFDQGNNIHKIRLNGYCNASFSYVVCLRCEYDKKGFVA